MTHEPRSSQAAARALPLAARLVFAAAAVCLMGFLAWASLRAGVSRFFADHSLRARDQRAAQLAARLAPEDPEAHFARAWLHANAGDLAASRLAYERALELRPRDHVLWLELGKLLERSGNTGGALGALARAAELAPHYAQPRWQLGNALLRAGRRDDATRELRRAAESDPTLYPNFVETLWRAGGRDARALARDAGPKTPEQTLALVRFLIKAGAAAEGLGLLRESGAAVPAEARRALVADLIAAEEFAGAYEVWADAGGAASRGSLGDGGFESETRASDVEGFGWRFAERGRGVNLSLDAATPREGARSLKVEYAGVSEPSARAVSQLVAVEPGARYRLTFAARTKELVTGGPPFVEVAAASKSGEPLAATAPLSPAMLDWREFSLEFTAPAAGAVRVALRRQPCATSPCPAFGSVWLDAFELRRL